MKYEDMTYKINGCAITQSISLKKILKLINSKNPDSDK